MPELQDRTLTFRVTASVEAQIREAAERQDVRLADWLRQAVLDAIAAEQARQEGE